MTSYTSYQQIRADLLAGKTSCATLVKGYLDRITQLNPEINAFLEVFEHSALAKAEKIDQKMASGEKPGKLAGLVVGVKDLFCYVDHNLRCGSKILEGFESQFTATAIQRLLDEDVIIIGRQNCDEFGMGSSNENSAYGPVKNPIDQNRVTGGSSGGSAAAVVADMCHASIGSDTGGSVRQPAAFCGLFGFKPTYSLISRYGLVAYSSSFDVVGTLTKSAEDAALMTEVMAGEDDYDSTVSTHPVPQYSKHMKEGNRKFKVAVIQEINDAEGISEDIKSRMDEKVTQLQEKGHDVESVSFPYLEYLLPTYYILTTAEASSNLARYDGVKYGFRASEVQSLEQMYKLSRSQGFGEEVRRRILLGTFVLSASYYDAYYTKAQKARRLIKEKTQEILADHDFILLPTTPTTAFHLGEHTKNPLEMYLADLFTVQASVSGIPAMSVPCGSDGEGMPIGLQLIGNTFTESELLLFSKELETL
ncbi:MAG: Asp-tRNA(Asn)/Glu-tRNA(Gln) amidotransferase subunit GatA [Cyclobacteriaceae bacterium]|nr:Asp-tRNA(Asn)/Glu-tRNA(Gln) amidotransferase subunit GatA [Cyclobacteriaceae bacterium HetDA_MAG_MS6]